MPWCLICVNTHVGVKIELINMQSMVLQMPYPAHIIRNPHLKSKVEELQMENLSGRAVRDQTKVTLLHSDGVLIRNHKDEEQVKKQRISPWFCTCYFHLKYNSQWYLFLSKNIHISPKRQNVQQKQDPGYLCLTEATIHAQHHYSSGTLFSSAIRNSS